MHFTLSNDVRKLRVTVIFLDTWTFSILYCNPKNNENVEYMKCSPILLLEKEFTKQLTEKQPSSLTQ